MTVPGQHGANAMLVNGWQTTPAGRQLPSGDMILSGQVSPDGRLFAFTNTGYTQHALHIGKAAISFSVSRSTVGAVVIAEVHARRGGGAVTLRRIPGHQIDSRRQGGEAGEVGLRHEGVDHRRCPAARMP